MIQQVSITHFKSIKKLELNAKRVNVFIGEPNTGKSNLLEALGLFSLVHGNQGQIRFKNYSNLFFDNDVSEDVIVKADQFTCKIPYNHHPPVIKATFSKDGNQEEELFQYDIQNDKPSYMNVKEGGIKYYLFRVLEKFNGYNKYLEPPYGQNLFQVLFVNKDLRALVSEILRDQGYQLLLRNQDQEIEVAKVIDNILYAYPYQTLSDTLQRLIFYLAAIKTNYDATILLEEPENNIFPFYTKFLAEQIADDTNNQYFLVTHNPYFLISLVEKTKQNDIQVFVTYSKDYQTQVKPLEKEELSELLDYDASVFFNLDTFLASESIR